MLEPGASIRTMPRSCAGVAEHCYAAGDVGQPPEAWLRTQLLQVKKSFVEIPNTELDNQAALTPAVAC
jgi:hypothetical protein